MWLVNVRPRVFTTPAFRTVLQSIPLVAALVTLIAFYPGSVDHDFPATIAEAEREQFSGFQSPLAAITVRILSVFGGYVAPLFIIKVLAAYGAVTFAVRRTPGWWQPLVVLLLGMGPIFLVLTPTLRLSFVTLSLVSLGFSLGMYGSSRTSLILSFLSFVAGSLFSTGYGLGYVATAILILVRRQMNFVATALWTLSLAIAMFAVSTLLLWLYGAQEVGRDRALYVSKLSDIVGVYHLGGALCLDEKSTKTGRDPKVVIDRSYVYGRVGRVIWFDKDGFAENPSPQQIQAVDACWASLVRERPMLLLQHKILFQLKTFKDGWYASHFTIKPVRENVVTRLIHRLNKQTADHNVASLPIYIVFFCFTTLGAVRNGSLHALKLAALALIAAGGFLLPHLLFGQGAIARYTVNSSEFLLAMSAWQLAGLRPSWAATSREENAR